MLLDVSGISHRGARRSQNQDGFVVGSLVQTDGSLTVQVDTLSELFQRYGLFLAVADGMGGHSHGDAAGLMTLETVALATFDLVPCCPTPALAIAALRQSLSGLHHELISRGDLGSTLIGLLLTSQYAISVQLGDSRFYRFREDVLSELSQDQAIETLTTDGPVRRLTSCLGGGREDLFQPVLDAELRWGLGDQFLLCSDGLSSCLTHIALRDALRRTSQSSTSDVVRVLLNEALSAGAPDNVTALYIRCVEAPVNV